jgi:hypothetical protein
VVPANAFQVVSFWSGKGPLVLSLSGKLQVHSSLCDHVNTRLFPVPSFWPGRASLFVQVNQVTAVA